MEFLRILEIHKFPVLQAKPAFVLALHVARKGLVMRLVLLARVMRGTFKFFPTFAVFK